MFGLYSVYCCRCGTHLLDVDVDGCGEEALGVEVVGTTLHHGLQIGAHHAVEDFRAIEHHLDGLCEVILLLVEVEAHLAFSDGFVLLREIDFNATWRIYCSVGHHLHIECYSVALADHLIAGASLIVVGKAGLHDSQVVESCASATIHIVVFPEEVVGMRVACVLGEPRGCGAVVYRVAVAFDDLDEVVIVSRMLLLQLIGNLECLLGELVSVERIIERSCAQ